MLDDVVASLESSQREMQASLKAIELSGARLEATLVTLATKADIAALTERLSAHTSRLAALEDANKTTIAPALNKTIGLGGAMTLFVAQATIVGAAVALLRYFHIL